MTTKNIFLVMFMLIAVNPKLYAPPVVLSKGELVQLITSGTVGATAGGMLLASMGSMLGESAEPLLGPLAKPAATLLSGAIGTVGGGVIGIVSWIYTRVQLTKIRNKIKYGHPDVYYSSNPPKSSNRLTQFVRDTLP